jgi:hypothetical protein
MSPGWNVVRSVNTQARWLVGVSTGVAVSFGETANRSSTPKMPAPAPAAVLDGASVVKRPFGNAVYSNMCSAASPRTAMQSTGPPGEAVEKTAMVNTPVA